ncbi:MAG: glycosyltransferase [Candidatus Glassbacteria bacterium]|nr:glycosyltransferase [Candidatus Glassbacteria bacterium]
MNAACDCDLSLIIPCYNEEEILEENFRKVVAYLNSLRISYELILVEDCSRDNTAEIIRRLAGANPGLPLRTVFHQSNRGRGAAVRTGLTAARGKVAGFIDIDLEVPEWYILPCVLPILEGDCDIATGYRTYKLHFNFFLLSRHILSHGYRHLIRLLLQTGLKDTETGYKFFHREKILPVLAQTRNDHWFWDTEIMLLSEHSGLRIKEVPCLFIRNPDKTSTVKVFRDSLDYLAEVVRCRARLKKLARTRQHEKEQDR